MNQSLREQPTTISLFSAATRQRAVPLRAVTEEEVSQLKEYLTRTQYQDREITDQIVDAAYLFVLPDYCTGGPGFFGKVLVVLYDGGPEQVETYTWRDGQIEPARQDHEPESLS